MSSFATRGIYVTAAKRRVVVLRVFAKKSQKDAAVASSQVAAHLRHLGADTRRASATAVAYARLRVRPRSGDGSSCAMTR